MARNYLPQDGYAIMTLLVRQATGQTNITVTDMNSFISAGETLMTIPKENVYDALSLVTFRLKVASRAYKGKLALMNALDSETYANRLRKISFYAADPLPSGWYNTNLFTNLADGFTAGQNPDGNGDAQSTKSQWEQHQKMMLEMNFGGTTTWQHCITLYENQFNAALRDPSELAAIVAGMITEHENDIESAREAFNRMALLNKILQAYLYDKGAGWTKGQAINMTTVYNTFYGTNYTSAQLRSTYLKSFLELTVATIKQELRRLGERTAERHLPMTKTVNGVNYNILRHSTMNDLRMYLYTPLIDKAEAIVMPEIFNTEYLRLDQYEGVEYWQSNYSDAVRPTVKGRCGYYDKTTGAQTSSGDMTLDYVIAFVTDVDGLMTDFQLETANTTPLEARKGYRNTWLTFAKNAITDPTENSVLFYMNDEDVTPAPEPTPDAGDGDAKAATTTKKSTSK